MKKFVFLISALLLIYVLSGCGEDAAATSEPGDIIGTYMGVSGKGVVTKDEVLAEDFRGHRFEIGGEIKEYGIIHTEGYTIQNTLKIGKEYKLVFDGDVITEATPLEDDGQIFDSAVKATPGEKTVLNLLKTAVMPLGHSLYVYGGGWNYQNDTSAYQTMTIGVPEQWADFFNSHDVNYNYKFVPGTDNTEEDPEHSYYDCGKFVEYYYAGVDCSGYMGWMLFNIFNTESSTDFAKGYVGKSTSLAQRLSVDYKYGSYEHEISELLPGDFVSLKGHVYMVVGTCEDGSVVIIHSTPTASRAGEKGGGIQLSAINPKDTAQECEAYKLAQSYTEKYCPEWYERYEIELKDYAYYVDTSVDESCGRFSWDVTEGPVQDPEGIRDMSASEVLEKIFEGVTAR